MDFEEIIFREQNGFTAIVLCLGYYSEGYSVYPTGQPDEFVIYAPKSHAGRIRKELRLET